MTDSEKEVIAVKFVEKHPWDGRNAVILLDFMYLFVIVASLIIHHGWKYREELRNTWFMKWWSLKFDLTLMKPYLQHNTNDCTICHASHTTVEINGFP